MTAASYDTALRALLKHEGGFSNNRADPGGATNFGITIADYRRYVKRDATVADVKAMRIEDAKAIYRAKYWAAMRCDDLPAGVDYAVFDYGVNSGIGRAPKVLQRVVGLTGADVDGRIGPATMAAIARMTPAAIVNGICAERLAFLQRLKTWPTFGAGWGRRVAEVRAAALALARAPAPKPAARRVEAVPAVEPIDEELFEAAGDASGGQGVGEAAPAARVLPQPRAAAQAGAGSDPDDIPEAPADGRIRPRAEELPLTDKDTVEKVQRELARLKYFFVGKADGDFANFTEDAILAFRKDNGLPLKTTIDRDLLATLAIAKPRPIGPARADVEAPALAEKMETIAQPWYQKVWACVIGLPAAGVTLFKSYFPDADNDGMPDMARTAQEWIGSIPPKYIGLALLAIAVAIFIHARRAQKAAVEAVQEGRFYSKPDKP